MNSPISSTSELTSPRIPGQIAEKSPLKPLRKELDFLSSELNKTAKTGIPLNTSNSFFATLLENKKGYSFALQLLGIQRNPCFGTDDIEDKIECELYENITEVLPLLDIQIAVNNNLDMKALDIELQNWLDTFSASSEGLIWLKRIHATQLNITKFSLLLLIQETKRLHFPFHLPVKLVNDIDSGNNAKVIFLKLAELATHMGYDDSHRNEKSPFVALCLAGGLNEIIWFLTGQLKSIENQALALGKVFDTSAPKHLILASIYQISIQRKNGRGKNTNTSNFIGDTSFYQTFFTNAKEEKEYLLITDKHGGYNNLSKQHFPAATVSKVQNIAYLQANTTDTLKMQILQNELEIWDIFMNLKIPHIPRLYESRRTPNRAELFVDGFKNGDVFETLNKLSHSEKTFGNNKEKIHTHLFYMAAEVIFEFLEAIHQHGYLHLDLKPENLLHTLNEEDGKVIQVAVTDFGFVEKLPEKAISCPCSKGSPTYAAPEVLRDRAAQKASDIWSAAVTLSAIKHLSLFSPGIYWNNNQPFLNIEFLISGSQEDLDASFIHINFAGNKANMDEYDRWLLSILKFNPRERPTASDALQSFRDLTKTI